MNHVSPILEFDAVVFDMDGVLIDSRSVIERAWCTVAAETGRHLSTSERDEFIHGRTGLETAGFIFGDLTKSEQIEMWRRVDEIEETAQYSEIKGVCGFVSSLASSGVKIGLATSSWDKKISNALSGLGILDAFQAIVTRDDVKNGKPSPDPYTKCINMLGSDPDRTLVFEDSLSGVRSAVAAGASCIGIGGDELLDVGARLVARDFDNFHCLNETQNSVTFAGLPFQLCLTRG